MNDQTNSLPDPFDLDDDNATFAKLAPVKTSGSNRLVFAFVAAGGIAALGWLAIALH